MLNLPKMAIDSARIVKEQPGSYKNMLHINNVPDL
jgi:hypothetical protein